MKKLIRSGVFETNSSSSHSLSIADKYKEFVLDTILPDENGNIVLTGGEFGWEWFKYNDALTKANYALVDFENNESKLQTLFEVIKNQTGAKEIIISRDGDEYYPLGYIDHESRGLVPSDKELLHRFIFNKNSWCFGGNDNSTASPEFYIVPEYKNGKIIEPEFKFRLRVEGYEKYIKYIDKPDHIKIECGLYSLINDVYINDKGKFEDDNSIEAQMSRNRNKIFGFTPYKKGINFKNKEIYFLQENIWDEALRIFKSNPENDKLEWSGDGYKKCNEIEKELINKPNSPYVKTVKFYVEKI